jgi:hypothetical protein
VTPFQHWTYALISSLYCIDHPTKESFQLSVGFFILELILNGNTPDSPIPYAKLPTADFVHSCNCMKQHKFCKL